MSTSKFYISPATIVRKGEYENIMGSRDEFDPIVFEVMENVMEDVLAGKVTISGTEPENPEAENIWFDTTDYTGKVFNGTTWDEVLSFMPKALTENTTLDATTFDVSILSTDGDIVIQKTPEAGVTQTLAFIEPAPGSRLISMGIFADSNKDQKMLLVTPSNIYLQASDDADVEQSNITANPTNARMSYRAVGGDNSTLTVRNGQIIYQAATHTFDGIGGDVIISTVSGNDLHIKTPTVDYSNSDSIFIETGIPTTIGSSGNINITTADTTVGDTGSIYITTGDAATGDGGKIIIELGNGSVKDGVLKLINLPVYADNAAALLGGIVAGTVYNTNTGELRIVV